MKIIPAIDLQGGQCVRLRQGDFRDPTVYPRMAIEVATSYQNAGCEFIHIVDLDGAEKGSPQQTSLLTELASTLSISLQAGGGIRERAHVEALFAAGINRVVVGSLCVKQPQLVSQWLAHFGTERVVLALDVRCHPNKQPLVSTGGWQETSQYSLWDILERYRHFSTLQLLVTDIQKDGCLTGPNFKLYEALLVNHPNCQIQASGGIAGVADLVTLQTIGVDSVIIGKALYEERFTLSQALEVAQC